MALSFSTKEYKKYSFEVDGKPYFLPGITLGLFDEIAAIQKLDGADLGAAAVDLIKNLAPDARTLKAIQSLEVPDIATLFKDWSGGMSAGESKSSVE